MGPGAGTWARQTGHAHPLPPPGRAGQASWGRGSVPPTSPAGGAGRYAYGQHRGGNAQMGAYVAGTGAPAS
jgi:hypothetical protein